ncbi:hypothetical protein [Kaarinaea lacus]
MLKKISLMIMSLAVLCSTTALAQNSAEQFDYMKDFHQIDTSSTLLDLSLPQQDYSLYSQSSFSQSDYLTLAAAESEQSGKMASQSSGSSKSKKEFSERWFTGSKFHQYLGWASLATAVTAALIPKPDHEDPDNGTHHDLAEASVILGGAAMAMGLVVHYDNLSFKKGFSNPDNLHALLTSLGVLGFALASSEAPDNHAGYGIAGAVFMIGGIKITW